VDRIKPAVVIAAVAMLAAGMPAGRPARAGSVAPCGWSMASTSAAGKPSNGTWDYPIEDGAVSAKGRTIVFSTDARNLTRGDNDRFSDVFVRDLDTGTIRIVSRGVKGRNPNEHSSLGSITPDGKFLLFSTGATNVHPDANGALQIYRRNMKTGAVRLVSRGVSGEPANISTGGGAITPDGRYVVFSSPGTNMLYRDGRSNDFRPYSYVRDLKRGRTVAVSVDPSGRVVPASARSISADGRFVPFASPIHSTQSTEIVVRDLRRNRTIRISRTYDGTTPARLEYSSDPIITPDGRHVMFTSRSDKIVRGDTNGVPDVFVHDRRTTKIERVSVGNRDRQSDRKSRGVSISDDGTVVTFTSRARNLDRRAQGRWNGFAHDRASGRTRLFTICDDGTHPDPWGRNPRSIRISGNERTIIVVEPTWIQTREGREAEYQVYHRRFSILPPTILTTGGPYRTQVGSPVQLTATVLRSNGDPRRGVEVRFRVATEDGGVVWRSSAPTDATGRAGVVHRPCLDEPTSIVAWGCMDVHRYIVTAAVRQTDTYGGAAMTDDLMVDS